MKLCFHRLLCVITAAEEYVKIVCHLIHSWTTLVAVDPIATPSPASGSVTTNRKDAVRKTLCLGTTFHTKNVRTTRFDSLLGQSRDASAGTHDRRTEASGR